MEIIHAGVVPSEKKVQVACNNCHAVIRLKVREAMYSPDQREPGKYITCPTPRCGHTIWL